MQFTAASVVAFLSLAAFSQAWGPGSDKIDEHKHGASADANKGYARRPRPRSLLAREADKIDEHKHGASAEANKGYARRRRPRALGADDVAWTIYAREAAAKGGHHGRRSLHENGLLEALYAREAEANPEAESEAEWDFDWE